MLENHDRFSEKRRTNHKLLNDKILKWLRIGMSRLHFAVFNAMLQCIGAYEY